MEIHDAGTTDGPGRATTARGTGGTQIGQAARGDHCDQRGARACDIKENAEYHAAREQQGFIEGRIKQLEAELSHAQVIDIATLDAGSRVVFGATVELSDCDSGVERRYQIVGDLEADIKHGLIAISSPLARALIGKHEGDSVSLEAPGGTREYEIVGVQYLA